MFQHVQLFGRLNRNISCVSTRAFFVNCLLLEERKTYSTTDDCEKEQHCSRTNNRDTTATTGQSRNSNQRTIHPLKAMCYLLASLVMKFEANILFVGACH